MGSKLSIYLFLERIEFFLSETFNQYWLFSDKPKSKINVEFKKPVSIPSNPGNIIKIKQIFWLDFSNGFNWMLFWKVILSQLTYTLSLTSSLIGINHNFNCGPGLC